MLTLTFNIQRIKAQPSTIIVPDDYRIIQDAINAAKPGDTVFVRAGIYSEALVVNKSIAIVGEDCETTIIDASGYDAITVLESGVTVRGFTIKNGDLGVDLCSYGNTIMKNIIINSRGHSIWLRGTKNNVLENTIISTSARYGIWIYGGDNHNVSGNIITNHKGHGIYVEGSSRNTIFNNTITNNGIFYNESGVYIKDSPYNILSANTITGNKEDGIVIVCVSAKVSNNIVFANTIANNSRFGISIGGGSDNHTIFGNRITNNGWAICINGRDSRIFHNDFINNVKQVIASEANIWDDDYPSGGNYWSDYNGIDEKTGINQNLPGSDGIGDTPYIIDAKNRDRYPLVIPRDAIPVIWDGIIYSVELKSNSTISAFQFNQTLKQISFKLSGSSGAVGYCNVTIPKTLLKGEPWTVKVNGTDWSFTPSENETHSFIYFNCTFASTFEITIQGTWVVPEFPSATILPIFVLITLIATITLKKRKEPKSLSHS